MMMGRRPGASGKGESQQQKAAAGGSPLLNEGSVEATVFRAFPDPLKDYEQFTKYDASLPNFVWSMHEHNSDTTDTSINCIARTGMRHG